MRTLFMVLISVLAARITLATEPINMELLQRDWNQESVFARINAVTVLEFSTDRPISELRAVLDGKTVAKAAVQTTSNNLLVAIVPMPEKIEIHCRAGDSNQLLTAPLPENLYDNVGDKEYYGQGKHLVLTNWTKVYCVIRRAIDGTVHNTLEVEVK